MNREEKERLNGRLAGMSREEVNKLYKQASAMRKRLPRREEEQARRVSLDDLILRLLDDEKPVGRVVETRQGTVVWAGPQTARIRRPGSEIEAGLNGMRVAVGDEVTAGLLEDRRTWRVVRIAERRTKLSRPDVDNGNLERVIVANVDIVGIVVSVIGPPLHPRIIDRYLIAIERGGASPVLCVNKLDLLPDDSNELEKLAPYVELDVPILGCSTVTGQGIAELQETLKGKTAAFVGHSGVGKSSLMNAIYPELDLDTGVTMKGYGRGAHTTTASSLFEFPDGTRLIDTPGVRSFGLGKLTAEELQWHFPEFDPYTCKFRDCKHDHEPGCEVKRAAEARKIHPARYDTYLRLLRGSD